MPRTAQQLVYTTDPTDASLDLADYTEAIERAESHESKIKLLAQKQAAARLLYPRRRLPARPQKPDIYLTRNGSNWRVILAKKQRQDRKRRRDCVSVADIELTT